MRAASCISLFPWTLKRRKKMQRHGRQIGVINSSSILGFCSRNKAIPGGTQGCWLMMMTIALMHCGQNSSGCTLGDLPHSSSPCRGGWVCWWLEKCSFILFAGWGEWTEWGDCDDEGLQHRTRRCDENQEAEVSLCQGNVTQSRPCQPHEVPGKRMIAHVNRTAADCCRYKLEKLTWMKSLIRHAKCWLVHSAFGEN